MPTSTPLIRYIGTSYGLTPFKGDFVDYVEDGIPVKNVTKFNQVIGIGTTTNNFIDTNGVVCYFPYLSYHLQKADIHFFYPQTYHQ